MNILQKIVVCTKERIEEQKKVQPLKKVIELAHSGGSNGFRFEEALKSEDIAFICEIKRASPSKGVIVKDFPYLGIAKEYQAAGAAAISVLTEPYYFKGSNRYLCEIANTSTIPLLRKDFIVDSYMIYESKILGASAILLICSILDRDTLSEYISLAHNIGLSALVETHNEEEVNMALAVGARIVGVNNRDLGTFTVDITLSEQLRKMVPKDVLFVSESGIKAPEDIEKLRIIGVNAALIGETIVRSADKKAEINRLRGERYGKD